MAGATNGDASLADRKAATDQVVSVLKSAGGVLTPPNEVSAVFEQDLRRFVIDSSI
jgi:hypothetical protein